MSGWQQIRDYLRGGSALVNLAMVLPIVGGILSQVTTARPELVVQVGYMDNARPSPSFPSPWIGDRHVNGIGAGPQYDAGAIRIVNPSSEDVRLDRVTVDIGRHHWDIWPASVNVPARGSLILTQTRDVTTQPLTTDFDTSEVSCDANSSTLRPAVHIRVGGNILDYRDQNRVLNAGGRDRACPRQPAANPASNESHAWEGIGVIPASNAILPILVAGFAGVLPRLLAATVVFAAGVATASVSGHFATKLADSLGLGAAGGKGALAGLLAVIPARDSDERTASSLLGRVVKWFMVVLTLELVASTLGISGISSLLHSVLRYLPRLFVALVVLVVGSMLARTAANFLRQAISESGVGDPALIGRVTEYAVIAFSAIVAVSQAGIAVTLVHALVGIVSVAVALTFGLAFGLGAQDAAQGVIEGSYSRLRRRP